MVQLVKLRTTYVLFNLFNVSREKKEKKFTKPFPIMEF